jgi:hypothetical protein
MTTLAYHSGDVAASLKRSVMKGVLPTLLLNFFVVMESFLQKVRLVREPPHARISGTSELQIASTHSTGQA